MIPENLIYLDNNATTRTDPAVVAAMEPYWTDLYMNPASVAGEIFGASAAIIATKQALASALGGAPDEFSLTSGATESNNWVLQSTIARKLRETGECHVIVSAVEHPSVLETAEILRQWNPGLTVDLIPVDENGIVRSVAIDSLVTEKTALVCIMLANNETGVIQAVGEFSRAIKAKYPNCLIHTDATQAVGKIPIDLDGDLAEVDFLSLSAHKFHGPKGVGALFVRSDSTLDSWLHGGFQQSGRRAGTENPALAVGLSTALTLAVENLPRRIEFMAGLRNKFESKLASANHHIRFLGAQASRLPNTSLLLVPNIEGELMVHRLLESGVAVSTGSACSNGSDQPSHVATAMGVPFSQARNVLRISLSHLTSHDEIEACIVGIGDLLR